MSIWTLLLTAVALAMDAFAVAVCKGISVKKVLPRHALIVGAYFGVFQALMPAIGFVLGNQFERLISSIDHWIAFGLLALIGANMIREALSKEEEQLNDSFSFKTMLPLAVATSIDALATGIAFACLGVNIHLAVALIGVITFLISCAGVKIGNLFGEKYKSGAELTGGIALILLGLKILLEHLGVLAF